MPDEMMVVWPLSEVSPEERAQILRLPPKLRDARIARLKADLKSGAHAKRSYRQEIDAGRRE